MRSISPAPAACTRSTWPRLTGRLRDNLERNVSGHEMARTMRPFAGSERLIMKLTDDEQKMLDGGEGPAVQQRDGPAGALRRGARRRAAGRDNNVCGTFVAAGPMMREFASKGFDAVFSEFNLDSTESGRDAAGQGPHLPADHRHRQQAPGDDQGIRRDGARFRKRARSSSAPRASTCSRPARPIRSAMCR